MRRLVLGLGLAPISGLVAPGLARGQTGGAAADRSGPAAAAAASPARTVIYHKEQAFRIPLEYQPEDRPKIREVQLWVSVDRGDSWDTWKKVGPDQPAMTFNSPKDGEYWFAVRTLDTKGRLYPAGKSSVEPQLRVVVDTTPPTIELAKLRRDGSKAAVRWEVRDENLDVSSLVIEFQAPGGWRTVPNLVRAKLGSVEWDAGTADAIRVRAVVADRANNSQESVITLAEGIAAAPTGGVETRGDGPGLDSAPPVAPINTVSHASEVDPFQRTIPGPSPARGGGPGSSASSSSSVATPTAESSSSVAPPPSRPVAAQGNASIQVTSPRFKLAYAVDDAGPSGPALVEMWKTRDNGQTWERLPPDADRTSPYEVDLGGEGTFGLTLCVESAGGGGDPPPGPGERPQIWVEVDRTPPVVQLDPVRVGTGAQMGRVSLSWQTTDAHPAGRPVLISYRAARPDARWQPIKGPMEDAGRFDWVVSPGMPDRFYLRVDVFDAFGNRGSAETTTPVVLDRTRPKGRILGLQPGSAVVKPKY